MAPTAVGIGAALLLSTLFTLLAATVEVSYKLRRGSETWARWRTTACFTRSFWVYCLLAAIFNAAGTLLTLEYVPTLYPGFFEDLGYLSYFVSPLLGVFAFEGVLTNTNITIFNKNAMVIQTWSAQARDPAVAAATEKQARLDKELQQEIAQKLGDLSEEDLNAHLLAIVGKEDLNQLEADAAAANSSPKLYKALELVNRNPHEAEAILKQAERSGRRQ